jgi:hypothetical protein
MARNGAAGDNDAVAISELGALSLLSQYGPATAEELARHLPRSLTTIRQENTLQIRAPAAGKAVQRMADASALKTALLRLQTQRKAISVTLGYGKGSRTLWMTPEQGHVLMNGIRRALGPPGLSRPL